MFDTPILFLVFNRPETTAIVFEKIRDIKPKKLFIAADGARTDKPGEKAFCDKVKSIVASIDWPCEVKHLYREQNLGCKLAVSGAITWFFEHIEAGIILEDDCFPSNSFFIFCQEMLTKYKDDPYIFHITGNNYQNGILRGKGTYYVSKYAHIWGWATWKRAWQHYELQLKQWDKYQYSKGFNDIFVHQKEKKFWIRKFNKYQLNSVGNNFWSLQWLYACWFHKGWTITPQKNLIKNIGFGTGTNTLVVVDHLILEAEDLLYPFTNPASMVIDQTADEYTFKYIFEYKGSVLSRIKYHLNRLMKYIK